MSPQPSTETNTNTKNTKNTKIPKNQRRILSALAILLGTALLTHFSCTILYLTPPNPIRIQFHEPLESYMSPWFTQAWQLFAPEPAGTDFLVLIQCKLRNENGLDTHESEWMDITTPLREKHYRSRLSPALLLARAQKPRLFLRASAMNRALRGAAFATPAIKAAQDALQRQAQRRFQDGQAHLIRIASASCDRLFGAAKTVEVRSQYLSRKINALRISEQDPESYILHRYEFPWAPYEFVTPF